MITCAEINKEIKSGKNVTARVPGFDGEHKVLKARVGIFSRLEVQILIDGEVRWRSTNYSQINVAEGCARS
jgi:hypothetical protein